jgi:predicted RNA-binding Zn-ribbon protein involved in translation (DUF1610 family)
MTAIEGTANGVDSLADWRALTEAVLALKAAIDATTATYGRLPCPRCGGVITWSATGRKRHSRGVCSTANCLRWIE